VLDRFGDARTAGNLWNVAFGCAGSVKRIWIATLFACLCPFGPARAQITVPPAELPVQFVISSQPDHPETSFRLRFPVPAGYEPSILICPPSEPSGKPGDADGSIDWGRSWILWLPNPESGLATVDGTLPKGISLLELSQSNVQLRIFLADRSAGSFLLSDPIPLHPTPTTTEQEHRPTYHDVAADSVPSAADLATWRTREGADGAASGGGWSGTEADSSSLPGTGALSSQQFQSLPLNTVFNGGKLWFGGHDQPIPIQGSGH